MMNSRLTYVPRDIVEEFGDLIIATDEEVLGSIRAKTRDYSMISLLKMLYALRDGPITFTDLYSRAQIRMKKSFLNYVRLCVDYGYAHRAPSGTYVIYTITPKGKMMLDLLHKDN